MTDVITLRGLRVETIVGALDHERRQRQTVELDLDLERPFDAAAAGDDLGRTTNYAAVLALATDVVVSGAFILLETLVVAVANAVLDFDPEIEAVTVSVRKVVAPVAQHVASVGARTTRRRS
jgi:FolB domain-containing protein